MLGRALHRLVSVRSPIEKGKAMGTKTVRSFLAATVMVISGFYGKPAQAAPSEPIPAQVRFTNAWGDRILSDAYGDTYRDGESGVACAFHAGTGDLTLSTSSSGRSAQSARTLRFLFGTPLNTDCPVPPGGSIPTSQQGASLNVRGIYRMGVGSTVTAQAVFNLAEGQLWLGRPASWPDSSCTTYIQVTHPDDRTWIITAIPGAGDVAVLTQLIKRQAVATYYWQMPFSITATLLQ
jgi:hypothetical protein